MDLAPGDRHYQAYVGPPREYDVMGATQFALLFALGLRSSHRLLDVGCGSLRAGRLLIVYLDAGNYFGIEPNRWLIEDAVREQIGQDLLRIKSPRFDHRDDFDARAFGVDFDFIVAQSVFSHAGPAAIAGALESIGAALHPDGIAAVTFVEGDDDHIGAEWVYPEVVAYRGSTIAELLSSSGLAFARIPWFHPRQTWYLLAHDAARLPDEAERRLLVGTNLDPAFTRRPAGHRTVAESSGEHQARSD